jgi:hypothetical protein
MDANIAFQAPTEVFTPWRRAQILVSRLALEARVPPSVLRATGFLTPELENRVIDWFTSTERAPEDAIQRSYEALEHETVRLFEIVCRPVSSGGLGVQMHLVRSEDAPYSGAAELCAELRQRQTTSVATIAARDPHPLLGGAAGGVFDQLLVVHDVLGHAALGVGFDLQSEFSTWLQCRTLFSREAQAAAFCELVGAVTTFVGTGEKPPLRADLPPPELLEAAGGSVRGSGDRRRRDWDGRTCGEPACDDLVGDRPRRVADRSDHTADRK